MFVRCTNTKQTSLPERTRGSGAAEKLTDAPVDEGRCSNDERERESRGEELSFPKLGGGRDW